MQMEGFVDTNFGGDVDTRCWTIRFVFSWNRGTVSWSSCLQPITALSTTEVEYIGMMDIEKESL